VLAAIPCAVDSGNGAPGCRRCRVARRSPSS